MSDDRAVLSRGGFSVLEASLDETLEQMRPRDVADILAAGLTAEDLVRVIATTPPFSSVLAERVRRHLRCMQPQ